MNLTREKRDGSTVKDVDLADFGYNYLLSNNWFLAVNAKYFADPISFVDERYSLHPAIGRDIWNDKSKTLNFQIGTGYSWEKTPIGDESSTLVDWRLQFTYNFSNSPLEAFHSQHVYKLLNESKSLIVNSQTGLRYNFSKDITLKMQLNYNYDSEPAATAEKDDVVLIVGAGISI